MPDNEIIKAKEDEIISNALKTLEPLEVREIIAQMQDTINRQKAEIESLKADKIIAERHEKDARELYKDVVIQLKTAKSEAIKEFVERLKEKAATNGPIAMYRLIDVWEINNLLEEMESERG